MLVLGGRQELGIYIAVVEHVRAGQKIGDEPGFVGWLIPW
jgi:hypothetical protein